MIKGSLQMSIPIIKSLWSKSFWVQKWGFDPQISPSMDDRVPQYFSGMLEWQTAHLHTHGPCDRNICRKRRHYCFEWCLLKIGKCLLKIWIRVWCLLFWLMVHYWFVSDEQYSSNGHVGVFLPALRKQYTRSVICKVVILDVFIIVCFYGVIFIDICETMCI